MDERTTYSAVVGQVIQRLRAARGVSQHVLAGAAGLSQSALSRFENGQSLPDLHELRGLARALGQKPGQFIELVEQAYVRTTEVAKKVSPAEGIAAVALGSLALIAVAAILEDAKNKAGKKSR